MGVYSYWNATGCSVSTCQGYWDYNSCETYLQQGCGSDTCNTSGTEYEYCQDGNVWAKNDGRSRGCATNACYDNFQYCNPHRKEKCQTGYICKETGTNQAECVAKSTTWVEE